MSKNSFKNGFVKFMSGKGFYAALAVCLIGTGAAAWVAVDRTLTSIDENNQNFTARQSSSSEDFEWGFPTTEEAGKGQSDVEVSSTPSSSGPAASSSLAASSAPPASSETLGQPETPSISAYMLPIDGEIFNGYSGGRLVKDVTLNEWKTHNGIDIRCEKGTKVFAAGEGVITSVYNDPLWGHTVEILHPDGLTTFYCGLSKDLLVKKDDTVSAGQTLGIVEGVPCEVALDMHLHFAAKMDGNWVDPLAAMNKLR